MCQGHPVLELIFGESLWFFMGQLNDWVTLDIMEHNYVLFLSGMPIFSSLTLINLCQGQHVL